MNGRGDDGGGGGSGGSARETLPVVHDAHLPFLRVRFLLST